MPIDLEEGFRHRKKIKRAVSRTEIEHYHEMFFSKGDKGTETIQNYSLMRNKLSTSRATGTVRGMCIDVEYRAGDDNGEVSRTITLDRIFQNAEALKMFYAFTTTRLVNEGMIFWHEVESFQNLDWKVNRVLGISRSSRKKYDSSDNRLRREALHIWDYYLRNEASSQVCIPAHLQKTILERLENDDLSRDMFREAQRIIFRDMEKGIFREFLSCLNHRGLAVINSALSLNTNSPALAAATALQYIHDFESKEEEDFEEKC